MSQSERRLPANWFGYDADKVNYTTMIPLPGVVVLWELSIGRQIVRALEEITERSDP